MNQTHHLKQPPALKILFMTEFWERFGFYIVQGLLVLYMTHALKLSDQQGNDISTAFGALAYILPLAGGFFASRIIGYFHAIILGSILLAVGYALLAMPHYLFWGLGLVAMGNGFFKPNVSSYLGTFYEVKDMRREQGYTLFYVGINLGSLLANVSSGYIVRYVGWNGSFIAASIGLIIGGATLFIGIKALQARKQYHRIKKTIASRNYHATIAVYVSAILLTVVSIFLIQHPAFTGKLMLYFTIVLFIGLAAIAMCCEKSYRKALWVCLILMLSSIIFWATFFQLFFSFNLLIDRMVNHQLWHFNLPTPVFLSLESLFILAFGPILAVLWKSLAKKKLNPSIPLKFSLSFFVMVAAFFVLYLGIQLTATNTLMSKSWIVLCYWLITIGELLLSPIGLAMITMLTPPRLTGFMMGVWFVCLGLGIKMAGYLANYAAIPKAQQHNMSFMHHTYAHALLIYLGISLVCALISLLLVPFMKNLLAAHHRE